MKKKQIIGIATGVALLVAAALVVVGFTFTAPGVSVNGEEIGLKTQSTAFKNSNNDLANTPLTINDKEFKYSDIGVYYDEKELKKTLKDRKLIQVNNWNDNVSQTILIDEKKLQKTVEEAFPETYVQAINYNIALNDDGETWSITEGRNATLPVVEDLRKAIEKDLTAERQTDEVKSYELKTKTVEPEVTKEDAEKFIAKLDTMADEAGYYEGEELKLDIPRSDFFELVKVEQARDNEEGFTITPREDNLRNNAETVGEQVNRAKDNGEAIVDENGKVLKTLDSWQDGYKFSDVDGLTERSVANITEGSSKFQLEGEITKAEVKKNFHRIEVDLSKREVRTYNNDKLVKSYAVAIGKPSTPTDKGHFKVFHQTKMMDMGCTPAYDYCTKDVPFATFYNGGEAFHGTWWHSDFGNPNGSMRSHGCVNMTRSDAEEIYYFAQTGTPVHVF